MTEDALKLIKTDAQNPDFVALVQLLDAELAIRDGAEHSFYNQYNKITDIRHIIIAYHNNIPIGCGAIKEYASDTMEIKRMFTSYDFRGKGAATIILNELQQWASQLGYKKCILETGKKQPEAISLYIKNGFRIIENYGQYTEVDNSVCFEKVFKE
jgi:putative acetyltransferase